MTMRIDPTRLEELILARLRASGAKPPTPGELKKKLAPLVEHGFSPGEWSARFAETLEALTSKAEITAKPLALTDRGRERVAALLGGGPLPARITWAELETRLLATRALEVDAPSKPLLARLGSDDGAAALILRQRHQLPLKEAPTLTEAADALILRRFGIEGGGKVTAKRLRALVLAELLGVKSASRPEELQRQLAIQALGVPVKTGRGALRRALVAGWLARAEAPAPPPRAPEPPEPAAAEAPSLEPRPAIETLGSGLDLSRFAASVQRAAGGHGVARFGEHKVYISSLWRHLGGPASLSLDAFKRRLVEANHAGLLRLARADLVAAMDASELEASETRHLNATFHFVEAEENAP